MLTLWLFASVSGDLNSHKARHKALPLNINNSTDNFRCFHKLSGLIKDNKIILINVWLVYKLVSSLTSQSRIDSLKKHSLLFIITILNSSFSPDNLFLWISVVYDLFNLLYFFSTVSILLSAENVINMFGLHFLSS